MTCSTWHVRVDLIEDAGHLRARAKLVGAPAAVVPRERAMRGGAQDVELLLASWRPLDELAQILTETLAGRHQGESSTEEKSG